MAVPKGYGPFEFAKEFFAYEPKPVVDVGFRQFPSDDELFEERKRVAKASPGELGNAENRSFFGFDSLFLGYEPEPFGNVGFGYAAEIVTLGPGNDGLGNLVHVGGRKNEFDVFGRFFERF